MRAVVRSIPQQNYTDLASAYSGSQSHPLSGPSFPMP